MKIKIYILRKHKRIHIMEFLCFTNSSLVKIRKLLPREIPVISKGHNNLQNSVIFVVVLKKILIFLKLPRTHHFRYWAIDERSTRSDSPQFLKGEKHRRTVVLPLQFYSELPTIESDRKSPTPCCITTASSCAVVQNERF